MIHTETVEPGHHPEGSHPDAEHFHNDALVQSEPRRDRIQFVLASGDSSYSIEATLLDGEVQSIHTTDAQGYTTQFPGGVLEQLMMVVSSQEQMIRGNIARSQALAYGVGGLMIPQMNQLPRGF